MSEPAFRSLFQRYRQSLKNLAWLSVASFAVKPLWFAFVTLLCARVLGAEGYGAFSTALSLSALVFAGTSFGINQFTVREVAADRSLASLHFTNFTVLRVAAYVAATLVALTAAAVMGYERGLILAVGLGCVFQAGTSLREYSYSFFQAFERLRPQAVSVVLDKVLVVALGTAFLLTLRTPEGTLLGMAVGIGLVAVGTAWWVSHHVAPLRRAALDRSFLLQTLRPLLPFGALSMLSMLFFRVDAIMVEALSGLTAAGQYGLAFRIVDALHMVPILIGQAVAYPRMARLASEGDSKELNLLTWMSAGLLLLASAPIALGITFTATPLTTLIAPTPGLAPAADVLRVLVWSFPLTSIRTIFYFALLSAGDLRFLVKAHSAGLVFNVAVNAVLIPTLGAQGAAIATILSEALLLLPLFVRHHHVSKA